MSLIIADLEYCTLCLDCDDSRVSIHVIALNAHKQTDDTVFSFTFCRNHKGPMQIRLQYVNSNRQYICKRFIHSQQRTQTAPSLATGSRAIVDHVLVSESKTSQLRSGVNPLS